MKKKDKAVKTSEHINALVKRKIPSEATRCCESYWRTRSKWRAGFRCHISRFRFILVEVRANLNSFEPQICLVVFLKEI
jgi:hypothetical protein